MDTTPRFRAYDRRHLDEIPRLQRLDAATRLRMKAVAQVLPFRVNDYVLDELIDWDDLPGDPIFQLTFPQPAMLSAAEVDRLAGLLARGAPAEALRAAAREIQLGLNPHPAGQASLNVPRLHGRPVPGVQHKYRETVLFFPTQGQTCHAYCTYCFRWPQFVGLDEMKFACGEAEVLAGYLAARPEVSNVLLTGGDPLVMKAGVLRRYLERLLAPELAHVTTIRIGSKALAYWPHRFLTDPDADELLRLFEEVVRAGRHLALMAHFVHPRELETRAAREALRRVRATGAVIRCQGPLVAHVNDSAAVWADLWRLETALGLVPYYLFVERDTGPRGYFEVPLARALRIFQGAYRQVPGLARTVRGPSMSATPGKVVVDGVARVGGEDVFVLRFLQARDPAWVGRPFFAAFDARATWLDGLAPAFGEAAHFYEEGMRRIEAEAHAAEGRPRRALPLSPKAAA
jgi:KamA family protein